MKRRVDKSDPITCAVNGIFNNAACGYIIVGGKLCGLPEGAKCVYQQRMSKPVQQSPTPKTAVPAPVTVKKKVLEKHVEAYLYKKMKKLGGECFKWASMNQRGVPDRICVFPPLGGTGAGLVCFVELKKDAKCKLSPGQQSFFNKMDTLHIASCFVLHGKAEVDLWLKTMGYPDV